LLNLQEGSFRSFGRMKKSPGPAPCRAAKIGVFLNFPKVKTNKKA